MKHLLIIGARGFGREIYNLAINSIGYQEEFDIKGYLDNKLEALCDYKNYPPIIDSVEHYQPQEDDVFICALGDVNYKKKYTSIILSKGGQFTNLIHKNVKIGSNTTVGIGCIFCYGVNISCDITIGDFVTLQPYTDIGHDAVIGDYCHLNTYSFLGGYSKIGNLVEMNTGSFLHPHKSICNNVVVGAGAYVFRNIKKEGITVIGNPAYEL
ncbi:acetyltransferase [Prevotella nigrescens]|jgi:bacterial transferase|uniref:acetyltransferase n=1 Tax=Prevotella nigrescens TaxID=28133 RepID=UPI00241E7E55|nr:acetyltransferase [Prevotella nigrescens]